jgi:DNA-binding PadR family transcriptional regulator
MSYIDILILRRLRSKPAHGYELRKRVEETVGVRLHNNSLYPALRRFEEAGAVVKATEPQPGGRPPRLVYTLTDTGRELLHDMLADLPPEHAADDFEFVTRVGQFSLITPAERAQVLAARTRAVRDQLAHLEQMADQASAHGEKWGAIVTTELIRRDRQELAWLADLTVLAAKEES